MKNGPEERQRRAGVGFLSVTVAVMLVLAAIFAAHGVYSIGRYGGWTYCSIEDNLLETKALARRLSSPGS